MQEELEKPCREHPYDDDYMVFDPIFHRYVLTEAALTHAGINLRARIARDSTVSPEAVIRDVCESASDAIYGYIHSFNLDTVAQDFALAKIPPFRPIIQKAMLYQAKHIIFNGNLYLSTDQADLANAINRQAIQELGRSVPIYGTVLYAGVRP